MSFHVQYNWLNESQNVLKCTSLPFFLPEKEKGKYILLKKDSKRERGRKFIYRKWGKLIDREGERKREIERERVNLYTESEEISKR